MSLTKSEDLNSVCDVVTRHSLWFWIVLFVSILFSNVPFLICFDLFCNFHFFQFFSDFLLVLFFVFVSHRLIQKWKEKEKKPKIEKENEKKKMFFSKTKNKICCKWQFEEKMRLCVFYHFFVIEKHFFKKKSRKCEMQFISLMMSCFFSLLKRITTNDLWNNGLEVLDDSLEWFLIDKNILSQIQWLMKEYQLMSMKCIWKRLFLQSLK